jgi:hypothetical protein
MATGFAVAIVPGRVISSRWPFFTTGVSIVVAASP